MADIDRVEAWLVRLGRLTSARLTANDAAEFVDRHSGFLADRFEDRYFTDHSLECVAAECKYLPGYGELVAALREYRPPQVATTYVSLNDNVVSINPEDRRWLAYWQRREAERFEPLRNPDGSLMRPDITDWLEHTLSLLRQYAPNVLAYVTRKAS